MKKKSAVIILVCLILAGIGLRGYHLTARSIWFDEASSWRIIQFPWGEMVSRDIQDFHPPLYFISLKAWGTVFGSSLLSMRSLSLTMAAISLMLMYLFASNAWRSRTAGLAATLLLAVYAWQIPFAWEARMYAMGTALALASAWLLLKAIRQPVQRPYWWLAYGVALAAFLYTHYYSLFTILAQVIFIIAYSLLLARGRIGEILQNRLTWWAAMAGLIAAILFAPWVPVFLQQHAQIEMNFWIPPLTSWSIPDTFYHMMFLNSSIPLHEGAGQMLTFLPLALVVIGSGWLIIGSGLQSRQGKRKKSVLDKYDAAWLTVLCVVVPFICSVTNSLLSHQSLYQDRYFVFANIFFVAGLAGIISHIRNKKISLAITLGIAACLLGLSVRYWNQLDIKDKPGASAAAHFIFTHRTPTEPIYASSAYIFFPILYYAHEDYQDATIPKLYAQTSQISLYGGAQFLTPADMIDPQLPVDPSIKSFWMVDTTGFGEKELPAPKDFMKKDRQVFQEIYDYQGQVIANHYVRK